MIKEVITEVYIHVLRRKWKMKSQGGGKLAWKIVSI